MKRRDFIKLSLVKHGIAVTAQAELIDLGDVTTMKGNVERFGNREDNVNVNRLGIR